MKNIKFYLLPLIFCAILGCAESGEPMDNYTYKVLTIEGYPVDSVSKHYDYKFILRYVYFDKEYHVTKVFVDELGELKADRINEENMSVFFLNAKYYPIEFLGTGKDYKFNLDTLKGYYEECGSIIDTDPIYFIAKKGK